MKQQMHSFLLACGVFSLVGCGAGAPEPVAGNAALGITEFRVSESAIELDVQGLDAQHALVGELTVRRGWVSIPVESLEGNGRTLVIEVNGVRAEHQSVGDTPVVLPPLGSDAASLNAFLTDDHVAPLLATWGVTIGANEEAPADGERAFNTCTYAPAGTCGSTACSQYTGGAYQYQDICCGSVKTLINRSCSAYPGTSACGTNGKNGCAPCWSQAFTTSCNVYDCSATSTGYQIDSNVAGVSGTCTPSCAGKTCGDDNGCGATCLVNDCAPGTTCKSPGGISHKTCGGFYYFCLN